MEPPSFVGPSPSAASLGAADLVGSPQVCTWGCVSWLWFRGCGRAMVLCGGAHWRGLRGWPSAVGGDIHELGDGALLRMCYGCTLATPHT
jgi:hypothetical protein